MLWPLRPSGRLLIYLRAEKDVFGSTESLSKPFTLQTITSFAALLCVPEKVAESYDRDSNSVGPPNVEAGTASAKRDFIPLRAIRRRIGSDDR